MRQPAVDKQEIETREIPSFLSRDKEGWEFAGFLRTLKSAKEWASNPGEGVARFNEVFETKVVRIPERQRKNYGVGNRIGTSCRYAILMRRRGKW